MKTFVCRSLGKGISFPASGDGDGAGGGSLYRANLWDGRSVLFQTSLEEMICIWGGKISVLFVLSRIMTWRICVWGQALWKGFLVIAAGAGGWILQVTYGGGFLSWFLASRLLGEFKGVPGEGSRASLSSVAEVPYLERSLPKTEALRGGDRE